MRFSQCLADLIGSVFHDAAVVGLDDDEADDTIPCNNAFAAQASLRGGNGNEHQSILITAEATKATAAQGFKDADHCKA